MKQDVGGDLDLDGPRVRLVSDANQSRIWLEIETGFELFEDQRPIMVGK